jgi:hypothetical protein
VKASQSGLDALCPFCREILTIVADPTAASPDPVHAANLSEETDNTDSQVTQYGLNPSSSEQSVSLLTDFGLPEPIEEAKPNRRFRTTPAEEGKSDFTLDRPALRSRTGKTDPIADAPDLIWYYRLKNHAERGPLKAKTMLAELQSGKISPGSIVWREDWETWLPAEHVFPQLKPKTAVSSQAGLVTTPKEWLGLKRIRLLIQNNRVPSITILLFGMLLLAILVVTLYKWIK